MGGVPDQVEGCEPNNDDDKDGKMDKETAAETYSVVEASFNDTGIPTREGIGTIIKAIKADGRFADRNIAFEEVAEPRFAIEVAKELGYKVP